jgi:hypothetical protein
LRSGDAVEGGDQGGCTEAHAGALAHELTPAHAAALDVGKQSLQLTRLIHH